MLARVPLHRFAAWAACALTVGCAAARQRPDLDWQPIVSRPAYSEGSGPVVVVDEAHFNYHTADGRYRAFSETLRRDGYVVRPLRGRWTPEALADADILVVANAIAPHNRRRWTLPTPSALAPFEIENAVAWLRDGGGLLLIADHMPFPGAAAALAAELGFLFGNGFARDDAGATFLMHFSREAGTLADHAITRGRHAAERVERVATFGGQAFRVQGPHEPLLVLPRETTLLLPVKAWKFSDETPRMSAWGMLQGAVARVGAGRAAVFGEAAMFSAQLSVAGAPMGMNDPAARENQQFLLNVVHWLSGLLDETA